MVAVDIGLLLFDFLTLLQGPSKFKPGKSALAGRRELLEHSHVQPDNPHERTVSGQKEVLPGTGDRPRFQATSIHKQILRLRCRHFPRPPRLAWQHPSAQRSGHIRRETLAAECEIPVRRSPNLIYQARFHLVAEQLPVGRLPAGCIEPEAIV